MVQYLENYKKNIAIDMRKRGFSYSDIQIKLNIPKSTIVSWVRDVKLTKDQKEKLKIRRSETAKANIEKKISRNFRMIEAIKISSTKEIKEISRRELWLIGIILYWKLRNRNDVKNGVRFTSSDPELIKIFIKWLQDVGGIEDKEIKFDIFIRNNKREEAINFWSKITGFPEESFPYIYKQVIKRSRESNPEIKKRKSYHKAEFGLLRIRVKSSSMLARQLAGWIEAIQDYIL